MTVTMARFAAICVLALITLGAARTALAQPVASRWRDVDIRVDGSSEEWQDTVTLGEAVTVGAVNDGEFLYLTIITSDQQRRRTFAATGLTIWLDASGGRKHSFGIRLPGSGAPPLAGGGRGARGGPGTGGGRGGADAQAAEIPVPTLTYFELLGPGSNDRRRLELSAESGIEVAVGSREGTLVYELKVALATSASLEFAIGTQPGRTIGLGIETPPFEPPQNARAGGPGGFGGRGPGGGRGAGGPGGGRGGAGGGRGGRGPGGRGGFQPTTPLNVWTTVDLARAPA